MKTRSRIATRLVAACMAAVCGAAACGSSGGSSEAELIEWFESQGESAEAAACFAKELSNYSTDDLDAFESAESFDDIDGGLATDVPSAAEACADL